MYRGRTILIGAVATLFVAVGILGGAVLLRGDGTPPAGPGITPTLEATTAPSDTGSAQTRPDFAITTEDLQAMTLDERAIAGLSRPVAAGLVPRASTLLFESPLAVGRERSLGDVTGWHTSFSVDGDVAPPPDHQGRFGLLTEVHLFRTDTLALAEFFGLSRQLGRPVDPIGARSSGVWDDAWIIQGSTPREGYTEYSTAVVVRVGPIVGIAGLATTVPEDLSGDGAVLARALAERIRGVLTDLDAFEE